MCNFIGLFLVQAIHVVEQGGGLQIHTDSNMAASTPPGVGRPSIHGQISKQAITE